MSSWTQRLSRLALDAAVAVPAQDERTTVQLQEASTMLQKELGWYVDFFRERNYGPYKICVGKNKGQSFDCEESPEWNPSFSEPARGSFQLHIATDTFLAVYDF